MRNQTIERITVCKIIAVVRGVKGERLIPMAEALRLGGIDCIEITFDPRGDQSDKDVAAQLAMLSERFGDKLCIGSGTTRTAEQVRLAAAAGAQYIVSPSTIPDVIRAAREKDLVSIPGAFTPTEIDAAYRLGGDIVKLFPASFLGTEYLDQLRGPLGHIPLMANGGINVWNMRAFLDAGCIGVGIGRNLTAEVYKKDCSFGVLTEMAKAFRAIADNEREARNRDLK
ncbi:MAG: bifunctional 4-hydroxy-2-oxoglutarate aldolase/2-dehydro-3-deoxy-phosphogluconate aldolase [Clostridia bacterium]|nr:bifunctional 4-hydroxy-2-oxoglutarate aldolase/2-dehydro-3-deoxy-phosphogluconate aldolase [Clostridia bacterium]